MRIFCLQSCPKVVERTCPSPPSGEVLRKHIVHTLTTLVFLLKSRALLEHPDARVSALFTVVIFPVTLCLNRLFSHPVLPSRFCDVSVFVQSDGEHLQLLLNLIHVKMEIHAIY